MYVCICRGITESELHALADAHGARSDMTRDAMLDAASDTLGIGTGCGCCREFAEDLLERRVSQQCIGV
ncbi:MAG: (2Fe-2S)-binding protein [Gammaproteobacteria bacterium]|nr:(2Fe-2S)-binding protein [Gammaproteobacteria bacterium]MCY4198825.1 (2Fe-2S)-binding protein [Gammaproteobacteria bacterium]MCY4323344.1 (2Fe-2S)-binding protein [Gammaproteobacteria bacterium]